MARSKDFNEDEVLGKAVDIFWDKGYNGTSMQDLVDGLGISRSSLYDTYTDKHTLFVKALNNYRCSVSQLMLNMINNTGSAKRSIESLLRITTSDLLRDEQHKGCFMVNAAVEVAPHDEAVRDIVRANDADIENAFYEAIKKGQATGELSARHDALALARFIFNTVKGIRVTGRSVNDRKAFDDIIKITLSVLD